MQPVPSLLFADELLIMSMAATVLQQRLDAWQELCSVTKEHPLHKCSARIPRQGV